MKIIEGFAQGSPEWFAARSQYITASEFDNLVSPTWEIRKGQMPQSYLNRKLAEIWTGQPLEDAFLSRAVEDGNLLEEEARDWLAFRFGEEIQRPAFITTDDGRAGCSPDGMIAIESKLLLLDGAKLQEGIELKCPQAPNQVKYLLAGALVPEYAAQVHFSMFVTGWKRWHFVSYSRRLPKLVLTVERDEKIQAIIAEALAGFLTRLDAAYEHLVEINGARPYRVATAQPANQQQDDYQANTGDTIP